MKNLYISISIAMLIFTSFVRKPPENSNLLVEVNILHDENLNGKVDIGFMLPKEGIGFSNFQSIGLTNRPTFSKAAFSIKSNKNLEVKIIYF